jgi:riboflavin transporter
MKNHLRIKKLTYSVSLAAVAIIFGIIEIPTLLPFLKLDLSELAILIAFVFLGFKHTLGIIITRSIVRRFFLSFILSEIVGEFVAILASLTIVLAFYLAMKLMKRSLPPLIEEVPIAIPKYDFKETVIGTTLITSLLIVFMIILNFFVTTPLYISVLSFENLKILDNVHLTVFTFLKDPGLLDFQDAIPFLKVFDVSSYGGFLKTIILFYTPLNVSKGVLTSIIFFIIKPRLQRLGL